jgi:hypothetical protein
MLLVENVPQPEVLIVSGDARSPERRVQMGSRSTCPRWDDRQDDLSAGAIIQ